MIRDFEAYHIVDNLVHFSNRELQNQVNRLIVVIPALYVLHGGLGFYAVTSCFYTAVSSDGVFLFYHSKTHNLVAIINKLIDEPLQRIYRVLVLVKAAQKSPRPLGIFVVFVFRYEGEGALFDEVCRLIECVERNTGLENTADTG